MKKTGFTIIELLFVIAIIGVLISLGLSFAARETDKFKVQKAALQIQHILQSGMAWYVDHNNNWPQVSDTDFPDKYVGPQITTDPWGVSKYTYTQEPSGPRFRVVAKLPSNQLAQRVAALLPVAGIGGSTTCPGISDNSTVCAFVSVPGWNIALNQDVIIKEISDFQKYTFDTNDIKGKEKVVNESVYVDCPQNMIIYVIPLLQGFTAKGTTYDNHLYNFSVNVSDFNCPRVQRGSCTFNLRAYLSPTNFDSISVSFGYIALCKRNVSTMEK